MHFWTQTLAPLNAWLAAKSQSVIKLHACARAWWRGLLCSTSESCGQRCHLGDSLRLPEGPPPSSPPPLLPFLFPTACNWKCIYCRARGWTGEREALRLMKMWLRWGPQGLAPLQHHQLTRTVNFFLFSFLAALFVYCSLTYFSPLCLLVFSFSFLPFIFALLPLLSFVSFYRPWLGMYKVHFKCKWCRLDWYKFCAASSNLFKGEVFFFFVLKPNLSCWVSVKFALIEIQHWQ